MMACAGLLFHAEVLAQVVPPSFEDLGSQLAGGDNSISAGVSADGTYVVGSRFWSSINGGFFEALLWTGGAGAGMADLPGGGINGFYNLARSVADDGSIAVGRGRSDLGDEAVYWTLGDGLIHPLGDLTDGTFGSQANGVTGDGAVIVGQGNSASGLEAFRWTDPGGMVGLGDLTGGTFFSIASGLSDDGSVVVGLSESASGTEAFRWTSGSGMVGLGDLAGGLFSSQALDTSADGTVTVGQGWSASGIEACYWIGTGPPVGLGDLPGGVFNSQANAVTADGSIIVGFGGDAAGGRAFIWEAAKGMRSLQDVLVNQYGLVLTGWTLSNATDISPDGSVIVGTGTDPLGFSNAWKVSLPLGESFDASFECFASVTVGDKPVAMVVADFDGDGGALNDFAVANEGGVTVSLHLADGAGGFTPGQVIPVPQDTFPAGTELPTDVEIGSFVTGGGVDLVIARSAGPGTIFENDGSGAFSFINESCDTDCGDCIIDPFCIVTWAVPAGETVVNMPLLNNGRPALIGISDGVSAGARSRVVGRVKSKVGDGSGGYRGSEDEQSVGNRPTSAVSADFDGEGNHDLAIANTDDGTVSILLFESMDLFGGNTTGGICWVGGDPSGDCFSIGTMPTPLAIGNPPVAVAAGDLDGDGVQDLAVAVLTANAVQIWNGDGDGAFQLFNSIGLPSDPRDLVVGDLDGDTDLDIAVVCGGAGPDGEVTVLRNEGSSIFSTSTPIPVGTDPRAIVIAELTGEGLPDLAVANAGSDDVTVLRNGPDVCPSDTNEDGSVNVPDLLDLLNAWGACPCPCPPDTNADGTVNVPDLLELLDTWGSCA